MRLDPKYFNRFLGICAAITVAAIVLSTFYYASKQQERFINHVADSKPSEWKMYRYTEQDSVSMGQFSGRPVVVHFWATWSDMSMELNQLLSRIKNENPELVVVAAATRDGDDLVKKYIENHSHNFVYIDGTPLYQELMVPGVPSQLYLDREGRVVDQLVGSDREELQLKIKGLVTRD